MRFSVAGIAKLWRHGWTGAQTLLTRKYRREILIHIWSGSTGRLMATLMIELPPFVVKVRAKGRIYFYFRRGKAYVRLPHPADPTFQQRYEKLARPDAHNTPAAKGSFAELVRTYKDSAAFRELTKRGRAEYVRHLDAFAKLWGDLPAKRLTRAAIEAYKDSKQETPRAANQAMQTIRRLLYFAKDRGLISDNQAARIKMLKEGDGNKPWPLVAISTFREVNADDPMMLLALSLGLYTGQRRGDLIKMTRADYDGTTIAVSQNKTGAKVRVPVHPILKSELDHATPNFMLLTTQRGKAFTARHFSAVFHAATVRAGLKGLTLHGLRVTAATWLAEAGCTDAELQAVLGHKSLSMVAHYRRQARQPILAGSAMKKLERMRPKV